MKKLKKKRVRKTPKVVYVCVRDAHDPYDNTIGGPNDYAYGM